MKNHKKPLTLIIFGATGDLYRNKLSTALWNLFSLGLLPADFNVIGFARKSMQDSEFQEATKHSILKHIAGAEDEKKLNDFLSRFKYMQGNLEDLESFKDLSRKLAFGDAEGGFCANKLFYLAVPPVLYGAIFKNISAAGLTIPCAPSVKGRGSAWTRVLVEKPFGKDIDEAERLDKMLGELFDESQIFRIDHYLAKENVQNILAFRFKSGIFEPLLHNKNIERVRIVFHEKDTLHARGAFYDGVGALRDVGQNHMIQMLALVAMENPKSSRAAGIQKARSSVLEKIFLFGESMPLRGQYEGYLAEPSVKADSQTETFFRIILGVNNQRWKGIPFEMESGKALGESAVFIEVYLKKINASLKFYISSDIKKVFDAYEKVLYDCILGDQTIFVSTKEIMAEWKLVTHIIKLWDKFPLVIYPKGSKGKEIDRK